MKQIVAVLLFIGFIGCEKNKSTRIKVEEYRYYELVDTITLETSTWFDKNGSSIRFNNESKTIYYFQIFTNDKSNINFMGQKCPQIDKKTFIPIDNESIEILKYRYDVENMADEELDLFITGNNEILGFRELAWDGHVVFLKDKKIINALTSDTTTFFKYNYRFRPL